MSFLLLYARIELNGKRCTATNEAYCSSSVCGNVNIDASDESITKYKWKSTWV